ncbi:MAG: tyrosine-type recombinase/integrase, partial [Microlunatus sp.]|nr:tyrosine-type recombinase/integrase [Microlunatus sp.]
MGEQLDHLDHSPVDLAAEQPLSAEEARYVQAARAANTLRGYRSDWSEFTGWCAEHGHQALPATPAAISTYLTALAGHGAKVGTMSRRLSGIRFAHRLRDLADPTENARVVAVWEGIRRTHTSRPDQATPLMPPQLWDVLDACPATKTWKTKNRPEEPHLGGLRDRALILVGFVAALRRSELVGIDVTDLAEHPNGMVIQLNRSKTNQRGDVDEIVVLPRGTVTRRCPVTAIQTWLDAAKITDGPLFRAVSKGNHALDRRLSAGAVNTVVQAAVVRAGLVDQGQDGGYSTHSLRAGFVTYAHSRGASDRAIAHRPGTGPCKLSAPTSASKLLGRTT